MTEPASPPHSLSQWLAFLAVVVFGTILSLGIQWVFMKKLLDPQKVVNEAFAEVKRLGGSPPPRTPDHLGTQLQQWVGALEIILYASSVVFGYPEFIAVWLGTKYIAAYKTWAREPVGRTMYNRSLFRQWTQYPARRRHRRPRSVGDFPFSLASIKARSLVRSLLVFSRI